MYVPFHSQMQAKDAIAAELLADDATETIDTAYDEMVDAGIEARAGAPEFLNNERDTEVDILTGDAE